MKNILHPLLLFVLASLTAHSQEQDAGIVYSLLDRLETTPTYSAKASYSVLLPSAENEIVYDLTIDSRANTADRFSPCDFLIRWSLPTPAGTSEGFTAYSNGAMYRFRDQRLQEYHYDWDSIPFLTADGGVVSNTQFANLLPQRLASTIRRHITPATHFNLKAAYRGKPAIEISGTEMRNGYAVCNFRYILDPETALPLMVDYENNPGALSEQTVTINFDAPDEQSPADYSEETLIELFPDIFSRFRQSNFRVENLPGTILPEFSLPTIDGQRFTHHRGEPLETPTVIVLLDAGVASTGATIEAIRNGLRTLPFATNIIWAFNTTDPTAAEDVVGKPEYGETLLISARPLVRDCGVTAFPCLLFVRRDSTIDSVHLGFNKELGSIVNQKGSLIGR